MNSFEIVFYKTANNICPVKDFLSYSKYLRDGIFELRCQSGNNISRILYFFYCNNKIIMTNGFIKKTNKTPKKEIELAKLRKADYIERMMNK